MLEALVRSIGEGERRSKGQNVGVGFEDGSVESSWA